METEDHQMTPEQEVSYQGEFRTEAYSLSEYRELLETSALGQPDIQTLMEWAIELAETWGWEDADLRDLEPWVPET